MYILYASLLAFTSVYSYALVDPNFTLIAHPLWTPFRNMMVQFGYYQRDNSSLVFIALFLLFCAAHTYLVRRYKSYSPLRIALIVGIILSASYPFLSHDVFSYMFDAKIVSHYGQNPYLHMPLEFAPDPWLRFTHWTHRTYPYGPTFLPITLIPAYLSGGIFVLHFALMKGLQALAYIVPVYILAKKSKKPQEAMFWATHPLVLFEGIINLHNDLLSVSLVIVGLSLYAFRHVWWARITLVISGLIKYTTLPVVLLASKNTTLRKIGFVSLALVMCYLVVLYPTGVQPWYFLTLLSALPIAYRVVSRINILLCGVVMMSFPFVWEGSWSIEFKYATLLVCVIATVLYNKRYVAQTFTRLRKAI